MKTTNYQSFISHFILLSFLLFSSFIPAKYATGFKQLKKEITSFSIMASHVNIVAKSRAGSFDETVFAEQVATIIDSMAADLLDNRYTIEAIKTPAINNDLLYNLIDKLEELPNTFTQISYESIFQEKIPSNQNRYALFISYKSVFNPDFPAHYKLQSAVMGNVVITPKDKTKTESDICILLHDTHEKEIVFYDRTITSMYDPRIKSEIELMVKSILKKIYYK